MKKIYECALIGANKGSKRFNESESTTTADDAKREVKKFLNLLSTVVAERFCGRDIFGRRTRAKQSKSLENDVRNASAKLNNVHFNHTLLFSIMSKCTILLKRLEIERA